MANNTNKKGKSHIKKTFYDLLEQIPFLGPPIRKLIERRGGHMKKLGAYGLIVFAIVASIIVLIIWFHYQQSTTNNSPTANQSASTMGPNSPVIQVAPGGVYNGGISADSYRKQIIKDMENIRKRLEAELNIEFNAGYIIFSAKEGVIIPLDKPEDKNIKVDWAAGYKVLFTNEIVTLTFPDVYIPNHNCTFGGNSITISRHEYTTQCKYRLFGYDICFKIISDNDDNAVIVMGIKTSSKI